MWKIKQDQQNSYMEIRNPNCYHVGSSTPKHCSIFLHERVVLEIDVSRVKYGVSRKLSFLSLKRFKKGHSSHSPAQVLCWYGSFCRDVPLCCRTSLALFWTDGTLFLVFYQARPWTTRSRHLGLWSGEVIDKQSTYGSSALQVRKFASFIECGVGAL